MRWSRSIWSTRSGTADVVASGLSSWSGATATAVGRDLALRLTDAAASIVEIDRADDVIIHGADRRTGRQRLRRAAPVITMMIHEAVWIL